jgi:hypothetical protein
LLQPTAEWRDLLYRNILNFAAWLTLLTLGTLTFAATGWVDKRLTGTHPSGRAYVVPFVFILLCTCTAAIIYTFRLTFTIQVGSNAVKQIRRLQEKGGTLDESDAVRRQHLRAYEWLQPRSFDVAAALTIGALSAAVAWLSS